jgi:hypothetical protein
VTGQPGGNFPAVILNAGLKSGQQRALPMFYQGVLKKMRARSENPVRYELPVGDFAVPLNEYLGQTIRLQYTGRIFCLNCGQKTSQVLQPGILLQVFSQLGGGRYVHHEAGNLPFSPGYLPRAGVGAQPLLSAACGLSRQFFRAQGGHYPRHANAHALAGPGRAPGPADHDGGHARLQAGLAEVIFANHISDKTAWQRLLKEEAPDLDLALLRDELLNLCADELAALQARFPGELQVVTSGEALEFRYPVQQYPVKVKAFNLDNDPAVNGKLMGIKGQYLILDTGVINIRKYGGYEIEFGEKNV